MGFFPHGEPRDTAPGKVREDQFVDISRDIERRCRRSTMATGAPAPAAFLQSMEWALPAVSPVRHSFVIYDFYLVDNDFFGPGRY